jgi:heparan-alpha-glucosaminide N-acetyltransferase
MVSDPIKATSAQQGSRITSIDALRGFVMFMMIFVNDLAGAPDSIVPDWMAHFSDRHKHGSGMTFVDLVFPGFLFIVGMSIPFALGSRVSKGEPLWKTCGHVLWRTVALLAIGILMVHEEPSSKVMGWSGTLWCTLMYICAILAFCSISRPRSAKPQDDNKKSNGKVLKIVNSCLRVIGATGLVWLAFQFRGRKGQTIISLSPLHIHTSWYGILGLIGWAYLVASIVYLVFRGRRTAILGCMAVLTCLFAAGQNGAFDDFWLTKIVDIGGTLGSQAAITVGGLLLGTMLVSADVTSLRARAKFTFWFAAGCAAAALALQPLYGISKNDATPSWCLWSCAITAVLWFLFYMVSDVRPVKTISRPLALAGQNVLLTYLFSEMLPELLDVLHLGDWYDSLSQPCLLSACARSALCGIVLLLATVGLNRVGFRLKL